MWQLLKRLLWPPEPISLLRRVIDFTTPRKNHWLNFEGGDNFDARFAIRGQVARGDEVLVRMQSGRIGCYSLFSVIRDFTGVADWKARGAAIGYTDRMVLHQRTAPCAKPEVTRLLSDGTWRVQSDSSKLADLQSGFTQPTSEFWKIRARNEARRDWTDSLRPTSHL